MKTLKIVVLGGTGFVGHHLVAKLHNVGHSISVLSRNREQHLELTVLPRVNVENANVYDSAVLQRHCRGADAVINLIGILNERGSNGAGFRKAHVELTETVIEACKAAGVTRLLQMSALNAGNGESYYLITRGEAEQRVKVSGLDWTIFEPSVICGPSDGLFFRFAKLLRWLPVLPLARANARFAPVYVEDVASAMTRALSDPHTIGQTYELFGPHIMTLSDIVRCTAKWRGLKRLILPLPDVLGWLQAYICEFIPGKPLSRDNFRSLKIDSVGTQNGLIILGIEPTAPEWIMPSLLGDENKQRRLDRFREHRPGI